jgi:D-alanyl-D-alanine carboxypeptidase (penicillin-binding protein 5/6)
MNEKLEELGIADTAHFTNCIGLYDDNHYCTAYDMAVIMKAAVENELCREVLSAHTYTTSSTEQHPDGITISNWFLRRIEDKDSGGLVLCGKTGFVNQSGSCAVS